jgi:hypothetical protein
METNSGFTNGIGTNAQFNAPYGVSILPGGASALIADNINHLIRQIILSTSSVTTVAGVAQSSGSMNGIGSNSRFKNPCGIALSIDAMLH